MKTRAAVLWANGEDWRIEVDLAKPGQTEVVVRTAYAGLCHSDEHVVTGDFAPCPMRSWTPLSWSASAASEATPFREPCILTTGVTTDDLLESSVGIFSKDGTVELWSGRATGRPCLASG